MMRFGSKSLISFGFEFSWKIGKMFCYWLYILPGFFSLSDSSLRKILFFPTNSIRSIVIEDWKSKV